MIYASVPWARSFLQFLRESGFLPWLEATLKVLLLGGLLGFTFWLLPRGKKAFRFSFSVCFSSGGLGVCLIPKRRFISSNT